MNSKTENSKAAFSCIISWSSLVPIRVDSETRRLNAGQNAYTQRLEEMTGFRVVFIS